MPISPSKPSRSHRVDNAAAFADQSRTAAVARQLCVELQALTGNANASVLVDVLMERLQVGLRELEPALAFGVENGWIERHADTVALREGGRHATLMPWPPREPLRMQGRPR